MKEDIDRILIDRAAIAARVEEVARLIMADLRREQGANGSEGGVPGVRGFAGLPGEITLVPVLTGSIIFVADLIRHLPVRLRIRLISVTSYPGRATASQGASIEAALTNLPADLSDAHVLVVDDILDSGRTLKLVTDTLRQRRPASLRTCVLLQKKLPHPPVATADYVCFDIPDQFVVGYGLDFNGYYRNLPDIVTLRPELTRG